MVYNLAKTGAAIDAIHTKVDGIEAGADVTDEANVSATASVIANTAKISYTDAALVATHTTDISNIETKTDFITVTQAVDLDTMESNIATNNAKISYTDAAAVALNTAKISFDATSSTKLGTIEENADVTDEANVSATASVIANTAKVSFPEAPEDGTQYARKDAGWEVVSASGAPEGTEVLSTGVTSGYVLQADGDNTSSWVALGGGGDMLAATYDPTTVSGDAFAMDNMVEGATTKILTATERSEISANTAKTGITAQQASDITTNNAKVTYDDAAAVALNTAKISFDSTSSTKLGTIEESAEVNTINTTVTGEPTGSDLVLNIVSLTQAEYDAGTPVATTIYNITDA